MANDSRAVGVAILGILALAASAAGSTPTIGIPISRTYSIEEIGVSRGPQLGFDPLGRIAVISSGRYMALNDNSWIDLSDSRNRSGPYLLELVHDDDGRSYFGALASWGAAESTPEGRVRTVSMRPLRYPAWINSTNFTEIVPTSQGILFAGANGLVYLEPETGLQRFHELPIASVFSIGEDIYVSSGIYGTHRFDPRDGARIPVDTAVAVHQAVPFGDGQVIGATLGGRLVVFDGTSFQDFEFIAPSGRPGAVSRLAALPEGGFAAAVDGEGLFLFSAGGAARLALTASGYRRIYDLEAREPGVLWLARESSVEKLLYNDPISIVDQRSEVVVGWPQVVEWGEKLVIASNGRLYDLIPEPTGWHYQFREVTELPASGAWAVAANDQHLLIGNSEGVFARGPAGFEQIPGVPDTQRLFLQERDLCVAVGREQIAALRWDGTAWSECAPRLPGIGFPSVAHQAEGSFWIELGLNRAARIWYENGALHKQLYENYPWDEPVWINIGILKNAAVLSGAHNKRVYLDLNSGKPIEPPPVEAALSQAPVTIIRVSEDRSGVIWATHPSGALTLRPEGDGYRIDTDSLKSIRDQYPVITLINSRHAWISTESALYHVNQNFGPASSPPPLQPFVVAIADGKTGEQLYSPRDARAFSLDALPYSRNHLEFRYFAGGYGPLSDLAYEFTMRSQSGDWTVQSRESLLTLPNLEEGSYRLSAQLLDGASPVGQPVVTTFSIHPPWYRSRAAYLLYWSSALLACAIVTLWAHRRAKRKHDSLESLVRERTDELRSTLAKLTDEARTSATLAERNRLAGEIHDSLQQGLSGLALQLDATLKLEKLDPDVRSRLSVARRMVSFTRQEVQQAVWDLESPLLENDDLGEALETIASLIGSGRPRILVRAEPIAAELPSTTKHHLLRIAQEAITNAVRHSGARVVTVSISLQDEAVNLTIEDDGHGFDPHAVFTDGIGHFGLRGLKNRVSKIGAELTIDSAPDRGARVRLNLPLSPLTTTTALISDERREDTHTLSR